MLVLAIDHSSGVIRSCTGPSKRVMNAADTVCGPAVMAIGSLRRLTPSGSDAVHPAVDVEHRHPLAVDGDLDLLGRLGGVQRGPAVAVQRAGGLVIERHPEAVLAVGREVVGDRQAAARPERRALDLLALRGPARHLEGRLARGRVLVAHGQPADLGRGGQVALHHASATAVARRRCCRSWRSWCRAAGSRRRRSPRPSRSLHRLRVLGPVQALEAAAARGDVDGAGVGLAFQRVGQRVEHRVVGTAAAGRRHLPGPQLADHLLGGLEVFAGGGDVEALEREPAGLGAIAMAADAGLGDGLLRRLERRRDGSGRGVRRHRADRGRLAARQGRAARHREHEDRKAEGPHPHGQKYFNHNRMAAFVGDTARLTSRPVSGSRRPAGRPRRTASSPRPSAARRAAPPGT